MRQQKSSKSPITDRKTILQRTIEEGNQFFSAAQRVIRRIQTSKKLKIKKKKAKGEKREKNKKTKIVLKEQQNRKNSVQNLTMRKDRKYELKRKSNNETKLSDAKKETGDKVSHLHTGKTLNNFMQTQKYQVFPNIGANSNKININNIGKIVKLEKCKSESPQNPRFEVVDICFCVNTTSSMATEIYQLQNVIRQIVNTIQNVFVTQGISLRFAIVSYRDHNSPDTTYVTKFLNFTDQQEAINYLKTLQAHGGGDKPQAVHDGLLFSVKSLNWAQIPGVPLLRYLIHIASAQPHGSEFGNNEVQKGCTCGIQTEEIIKQINKHNIQYALMKVRSSSKLEEMEKILKEKLGYFISSPIRSSKQLGKFIPNLIKMDMLPS